MLGESRRRKKDEFLGCNCRVGRRVQRWGNPRCAGSGRIIECLDGLLPAVKLDPEPLLEEAQRIEGQIREMMALHLNSESDVVSAPSTMYG